MWPTSTSEPASAGGGERARRVWLGAALDLLTYLGLGLLFSLAALAVAMAVHAAVAAPAPLRVTLDFPDCHSARVDRRALFDLLAYQGEIRPDRVEGLALPLLQDAIEVQPAGADGRPGAERPLLTAHFEWWPRGRRALSLDPDAISRAAGCPLGRHAQVRLDGQPDPPPLPMAWVAVAALLALLPTAAASWWLRARRWPPLPPRMAAAPAWALALVAGLGLQALAVLAGEALARAGLPLAPSNVGPIRALAQASPLLTVLLVAGLAPAAEEWFFRGVLLRRFLRAGRPLAGVFASSLCFAALHEVAAAGQPWPARLAMTAVYALLGAGLALVAWRTGRLSAAIVAHATSNAGALFLLAATAG